MDLRDRAWGRRRAVISLLVATFMVASGVLVSALGEAGNDAPGTTASPGDLRLAGAAPADPVQPLGVAHTLRTLVLFNNSTPGGNDLNVTEGLAPEGVAYDSLDGTLWVTAYGSNSVAQVNVSTGAGMRFLPAEYSPWGIAFDPARNELFIAEDASSDATVLNAKSGAVVGHVSLGEAPEAVAYDARTGQVYFSNTDSGNVSVVNATTLRVVANVIVGSDPRSLVYDPTANAVVVGNYFGDSLMFINDTTYVAGAPITIPGPLALAYDAVDGRLYVSNASRIVPVDARTGAVGTPIAGSVEATALAFDPTSDTLYASDAGLDGDGFVQVIRASSETVVGTIPVGEYSYPEAAAYDPAEGRVSVADANIAYWAGYNVTEISTTTNRTVGTIGLQHLPIAEVYAAPHDAVFVYDGGTGDLYEVSDSSDRVVRSVFVGYSPSGIGCPGAFVCQGIAYDPVHDTVFVDYYSFVRYGIAAVNASTFAVTNVTGGVDAEQAYAGIAVDTTDHEAFVANFTGGSVAIVDTATDTLDGSVAVGSHPLGVVWDPDDDRVFVGNSESSNVSVFDGADPGVVSTVSVGGMPAGETYDPHDQEVYVANSGVSNNVTAIFAASLRVAANISVDATGTPEAVAYDPAADVLEVTLSGTPTFPGEVSFVNGTTNRYVGMVEDGSTSLGGAVVYDPATAESFVTDYEPGTVSILAWGPKATTTYPVVFDESGLPQGTSWSVTLDGTLGSSVGSSISFSEPNGSYGFTVGHVLGYASNVTSGTVRVSAKATSWAVVFTAIPPASYAVTFTESGLPSGTAWSVELGETLETESTASISFEETNATYAFTVAAVPGYTANLTSGSLTVAGGPVYRGVTFAANAPTTYPVTFVEHGLPAGSSWSVTFAEVTLGSSSDEIAFEAAAGSWAFSVGAPVGYTAAPGSGTVVVVDMSVQRSINFTSPAATPPGFLGLPGDTGYYVLGGFFAAIFATALLLAYRRRRRTPLVPGPTLAPGPPSPPPPGP